MEVNCGYCGRWDDGDYLLDRIYDAGCFGKLSLDMFIDGLPDEDPQFCISAFLRGVDAEIFNDEVKIYYCPMCGRKLR